MVGKVGREPERCPRGGQGKDGTYGATIPLSHFYPDPPDWLRCAHHNVNSAAAFPVSFHPQTANSPRDGNVWCSSLFSKTLAHKDKLFLHPALFFLCHAGLQTDCVVYSDVWILVPVTLVLVGVDDLQLLRLIKPTLLPFYGVLESHQKQEQPCGSLLGQTTALAFDQWPAEEQVLT